MILQGPATIPGQEAESSHGGKGGYFVRTLLEKEFASSLKYVRDLSLHAYASIGNHKHTGDEEIYFIISGRGIMVVDGEEREVGPGDIVLTQSGSSHALRNLGAEDLRIFVACAATP